MTKEQLFAKWTINPDFKYDLNAVIANEVAKAKEAKPEELKGNCSTFDMSKLVDQEYKPTEPFDKDRFEAMFRAVVASEAEIDFVFRRNETNYLLEQLDAYYATKNN